MRARRIAANGPCLEPTFPPLFPVPGERTGNPLTLARSTHAHAASTHLRPHTMVRAGSHALAPRSAAFAPPGGRVRGSAFGRHIARNERFGRARCRPTRSSRVASSDALARARRARGSLAASPRGPARGSRFAPSPRPRPGSRTPARSIPRGKSHAARSRPRLLGSTLNYSSPPPASRFPPRRPSRRRRRSASISSPPASSTR